MKLPDSSHLKI